jgi:hypothetical protein
MGFRRRAASRGVCVRNKNKQLFSQIDRYESRNLSNREEVELFTELLKSGMVWSLKGTRGHYGERAMEMLREGSIEPPIGLTALGNHDYRAMPMVDVSKDASKDDSET